MPYEPVTMLLWHYISAVLSSSGDVNGDPVSDLNTSLYITNSPFSQQHANC